MLVTRTQPYPLSSIMGCPFPADADVRGRKKFDSFIFQAKPNFGKPIGQPDVCGKLIAFSSRFVILSISLTNKQTSWQEFEKLWKSSNAKAQVGQVFVENMIPH